MDKHLLFATFLANLLDNKFRLFGIRFGISAFIGLIPGIGDTIDAFLALYLVWIAVQIGLPTYRIFQMIGNVAITFLIGLIPIIGDAGYLLYRPNMKNLAIIKMYKLSVVEGTIV